MGVTKKLKFHELVVGKEAYVVDYDICLDKYTVVGGDYKIYREKHSHYSSTYRI